MGLVQAGYYGICFLWCFHTFYDGTQDLASEAMTRSHVQTVSLGMGRANEKTLDQISIEPQGKVS